MKRAGRHYKYNMWKKFLFHIFFVMLAFVAVWIVANQKVEVFNKNDLRTLSCGWPLAFIVNDMSYRDPPFPWKMPCLGGEWSYAVKKSFSLPSLIIDVLVFYVFMVFLWSAYVILRNKMQRW